MRQIFEPIAGHVAAMLERCRREHGITDDVQPEADADPRPVDAEPVPEVVE